MRMKMEFNKNVNCNRIADVFNFYDFSNQPNLAIAYKKKV